MCPYGDMCKLGPLFTSVSAEMADEVALTDEALCTVVAAIGACRDMSLALDCSFRFWACIQLIVIILHRGLQLGAGHGRLPEVLEVRVGDCARIMDCADQARVWLRSNTTRIQLSVRRSHCR